MQKLSLEIRETIEFIRRLYNTTEFIPLHAPVFQGKEKEYVNQAIDSTFVSSVGAFVDQAEKLAAEAADARYAVAVVNGTAALQIALQIVGVKPGDEVITQALSFVATSNAIHYNQAAPVFFDVSESTMGLCPQALRTFFRKTIALKRLKAPSTKPLGLGSQLAYQCTRSDSLPTLAKSQPSVLDWHLPLVEDAAESFGSSVNSKMLGTFGKAGIVSFNGNKIITAGGGGMLITDNEELAKRAKHLTTTAKQAHPFEYFHNEVGYNFRMPNLNAALLCAQIEQLPEYLAVKRDLAKQYSDYFSTTSIVFREESLTPSLIIGSTAFN